jgi:hypothetical protein
MVEFPQPAIANTKAIAIIRNRGLDWEELNGMACRFILIEIVLSSFERIE